uniref:Uncharacterized protein n=1 Tax=virus sp. ctQmo6 TaxID=2827990 RepID=A0A8S5RGD5_9VIRU|nr:MAG TPA: hypothetical protein [virus sp. ctQmo6]
MPPIKHLKIGCFVVFFLESSCYFLFYAIYYLSSD